jgi:hypothetical protein
MLRPGGLATGEPTKAFRLFRANIDGDPIGLAEGNTLEEIQGYRRRADWRYVDPQAQALSRAKPGPSSPPYHLPLTCDPGPFGH